MDKRRYRFLCEGEATKRKDELDILMIIVFSRGLLIGGIEAIETIEAIEAIETIEAIEAIETIETIALSFVVFLYVRR